MMRWGLYSGCKTQAEPCSHESSSGVDQAPLNDPGKVWRCDNCGWLHRLYFDAAGASRWTDA